MFAGSLQGRTQTLPLAVYNEFELPNGLDVALAISALLVLISLAVLMTVKLMTLHGAAGLASIVDRNRTVDLR